jgi:hypothetical protein
MLLSDYNIIAKKFYCILFMWLIVGLYPNIRLIF